MISMQTQFLMLQLWKNQPVKTTKSSLLMTKEDLAKMILTDLLKKLRNSKTKITKSKKELSPKILWNNTAIKSDRL